LKTWIPFLVAAGRDLTSRAMYVCRMRRLIPLSAVLQDKLTKRGAALGDYCGDKGLADMRWLLDL